MSVYANIGREHGIKDPQIDKYVFEGLFMTITNANFDKQRFIDKLRDGFKLRIQFENQLESAGVTIDKNTLPEAARWIAYTPGEYERKAQTVGVLQMSDNEDIRSLRELLIYGIKGIAAYAEHAHNLGEEEEDIFAFIQKGLAATLDNSLGADELTAMVLECGSYGVKVMALLDKANTTAYGNPEITKVNIGVRDNPGILISGHDLRDMEDLLEQTKDSGVDVYTHSEMLPANYYPAFKKYDHFVGNYGNSWWKQREEFESFNGPILFTTNCIVPPLKSATYTDRIYTTGIIRTGRLNTYSRS
jgi:hydroxylamine reductase